MNPEQPEPDTVFTITLVQRAQMPKEYLPPIVRTGPNTYEVVRVLEDAERETAVSLSRYVDCACACGQTSCAGGGS